MSNRKQKCKGKLPFMKLYCKDWRDGTLELSLEAQGLYMRILTFLHEGEAIPSDPAKLSRKLRINPRTLRKVLPELVEKGKLIERNGHFTNPRIDRDLGPEQETVDDEFEPNSTPIHAEFDGNSSGIQPEFDGNDPKNPMISTRVGARSFQIPEARSQIPDAAARACANDGEIEGLNGSTSEYVQRLASTVPLLLNPAAVWNVVASSVTNHGADATKAAIDDIQRKYIDHDLIGNPLQVLGKFARRAKENLEREKAKQEFDAEKVRGAIANAVKRVEVSHANH